MRTRGMPASMVTALAVLLGPVPPATVAEEAEKTSRGPSRDPREVTREVRPSTFWEALGEARDLSGRKWGAAELAGKVVLVDFWATWCAPCLAEVPTLRTAYHRYRDRGFEIVGVSLDAGDRRILRSWLRRQRVIWPQIHAHRGLGSPLARRFGVESLPRSVLLDPRGRQIGADLRGEALLAVLASLFSEEQGL